MIHMAATLDEIPWPVRTARLSIRRANESDLDAIWRFRRLESVSQWLTSAPSTIEQYREKFLEPGRLDTFLVVELDGEVIGELMLKIEDGWAQWEVAAEAEGVQAELGWSMDPDCGGHGYATEAVNALIEICFEHLGLRRVTAQCFADNVASWRLMERIGMRREFHTVRDSLHRSGQWLDGLGYALLAEEWATPAAGRRGRPPRRG